MAAAGYWREISAVLVLKALALVLIYILLVVPAIPPSVTPASIARHLTAPPPDRSPNSLQDPSPQDPPPQEQR